MKTAIEIIDDHIAQVADKARTSVAYAQAKLELERVRDAVLEQAGSETSRLRPRERGSAKTISPRPPSVARPEAPVPLSVFTDGQLHDGARTLVAYLWQLTNGSEPFTCASAVHLARELGTDERTIRRRLKAAQAEGFIVRERRKVNGAHRWGWKVVGPHEERRVKSGSPAKGPSAATKGPDQVEVVDVEGAAKITGLAVGTLNWLRTRGDGPSFLKLGRRCVRYRVDDLRAWRDARLVKSTADQAPPNHDGA